MDKKSALYNNRPSSYVLRDIITGNDHVLVMDYGDKWRDLRKLVHQNFMESVVEREYVKLQNAEAVQMLRDLCVDPQRHMIHPKRFSNSIIMSLRRASLPISLMGAGMLTTHVSLRDSISKLRRSSYEKAVQFNGKLVAGH